MKILHGTWIPKSSDDFIRTGTFYLWAETTEPQKSGKSSGNRHPFQLSRLELGKIVSSDLGITESPYPDRMVVPAYFLLPTAEDRPNPSIELARYLEIDIPEPTGWKSWEIDCYPVNSVLKALNDIHFLCLYNPADIQLGADLLFWYQYSRLLSEIIRKDRYIPALKYREIPATGKKDSKFEIYPGWDILSETHRQEIDRYLDYMPPICTAGSDIPHPSPTLYDARGLLQHFDDCMLDSIVTRTQIPATFEKKIHDTFLNLCLQSKKEPLTSPRAIEQYRQWQDWQQKLIGTGDGSPFYLCFKLIEASEQDLDNWRVKFLVTAKNDPSLRLELDDYWFLDGKTKKTILNHFGADFEKNLLLDLGTAARVYPLIWKGLESERPIGFSLTLAEAFAFLKENAWILEDAGYKVIIPAWWTPQGRQRAKVRLKASAKSAKVSNISKGFFSLEKIVDYQYEIAIGNEAIDLREWEQLVNAKTPLVRFRGQWVELDPAKMQQMLDFWRKQQQENPDMTLLELLRTAGESPEEIIVETDGILGEMMEKLQNPSQLAPIENPPRLQGTLREYQKRGVAWIQYLEKLGLNGCLADDMGLGKTLQVITHLLLEKEAIEENLPTLLIVPTSVIGNWYKEIQKFAPHLTVIIHHGAGRSQELEAFTPACQGQDIVITSFTLIQKDVKLFKGQQWRRIVIDEAQNIKNPKAARTKAILSLEANHRLALTGTPVENRLLDLWSILNFLNPGYLGKETQFRKAFELPIQKESDRVKSTILKNLVEPFILRRVKTDKNIIKDLPDKVEHKQYCNLTKEQASLYEAVVKDVEKQLEEADGIQRKGLILSTLMKLKQICNHPRQFLQDSSEFNADRSHKLERLGEMIEEVISEGESLLIFTQFTEIGEALQQYLKRELHYNTYYLHGGTARQKREQMIDEFQNPDTEPSAFILSLKAGGVGITLTKANHVFHFDRWWNPAVENQATDRAFRIGQQKNVFVHKFVTLGTLEERIDEMIEEKKKLTEAIVGSDESWLTELDNESFKKLISLNRQTIL
ncbi:DEAD/DEAH box helicase [Pannus brasiliensis CCIBt3594]|uniref:DEAD/DEAH box helicase n=1 Tax=Pannus brasiliensis CCIBt3594 TaxID=1427578 RepID=A0AAW9QWM4_9CHRO